MKTLELTIKLSLEDAADIDEVVQKMDYIFFHTGIIDTEITEVAVIEE